MIKNIDFEHLKGLNIHKYIYIEREGFIYILLLLYTVHFGFLIKPAKMCICMRVIGSFP